METKKSLNKIAGICLLICLCLTSFTKLALSQTRIISEQELNRLLRETNSFETKEAFNHLFLIDNQLKICETPEETKQFIRFHDQLKDPEIKCLHIEMVGQTINLGPKCFLDFTKDMEEKEIRHIIKTFMFDANCSVIVSDLIWGLTPYKNDKNYRTFFKVLAEFQ